MSLTSDPPADEMLLDRRIRLPRIVTVSMVGIFLLLLEEPFPVLEWPGVIVLWAVVGLTVVSGAAYFWRFWTDVVRPSPRPVAPAEVATRPKAVELQVK